MIENQLMMIFCIYLFVLFLAGICLLIQKNTTLKYLSWIVFCSSAIFILWCFLDRSHILVYEEEARTHIYYQLNIFLYFGFVLSVTFLFLAYKRKFIYDTYFYFLVFYGLSVAIILRVLSLFAFVEVHVTQIEKGFIYLTHLIFSFVCLCGLAFLYQNRKINNIRYMKSLHPTILFTLLILFFHLLSMRLFSDEKSRYMQEIRISSHMFAGQINELAKKQKNILQAVVLSVANSSSNQTSIQKRIQEAVFTSIEYSSRIEFNSMKSYELNTSDGLLFTKSGVEYSITVPVIQKDQLLFYTQIFINIEALMLSAYKMLDRPFLNVQVFQNEKLLLDISKDDFKTTDLFIEQVFEVFNVQLKIRAHPTWKSYRASLSPVPRFVYLMGFLLASILAHLFFVYKCLSESYDLVESEVKLRTQELEIQKKKTEIAHQTQTLFLANMSHEIRTPLNIMSGVTDLLLDTQMDSQQKNYISMIQNASAKLLRLINDLIDLSKVETGQITLREDLFDLKKMVFEVAHFYQVKASEKSLKLIVDEQMLDHSWFIGDPIKLKQIIGNLLNNAVKFTESGGATLSVWNDKDQIYFRISDTGVGIPEDKKDDIFDMFVQVDSSFTRKAGGAGLGLSIAKNLIEIMGGKIRVASELHFGTVFEFEVHLKRYLKEHVENEIDVNSQDQNTLFPEELNILIVDDSLENRQLIKIYLSKYQCQIFEAENGMDAVAIAENNPIDIILMDLQMPIMDGYSAIEQIRSSEEFFFKRKTPIIVITAHALKEDEVRCRKIGANEYLTKPLSRNKLTYAILNQLTLH